MAWLLLAVLFAAAPAEERGRLVLVGGGDVPASAVARCLEGNGGRVLIVPTASASPEESAASAREMFSSASAVDAIDPARAVEQIGAADVVWFCGGDQSRITAAYRGTPVFDALHARFAAGAVVAGTSAGAAMASDLMMTGEGDFERIDPGAVELAPGMEFLRGAIVDQHFVRRRRFNRLVSAVMAHPDHVGVGIDEDAAAEIEGGRVTSIEGTVVVVRGGEELRVRVLRTGESADLTPR